MTKRAASGEVEIACDSGSHCRQRRQSDDDFLLHLHSSHLHRLCFFRKRGAAPADEAELGLTDTILNHGILAQLFEIHVTVHGLQQFIIGTMAACFLFMKLQQRVRTGAITLLSNTICAASAVAVCFCRSQWSFFALYTIYMLSLNVTAYAIPAGVIYSTPVNILPFISSMRMFVFNGALCALLTPVAGLMTIMPTWQVMAIGGAAFILCGVLFFRQFQDKLKV